MIDDDSSYDGDAAAGPVGGAGGGALPLDGDPVEHLWNAAHEMLRAFRTLIDAADEFVESQRGVRPPGRGDPGSRAAEPKAGRVHRIDIDIDERPA